MTDDRLEQIVATLLRVGVLISATIVLAGGIWLLAEPGSSATGYGQFHGEPPELRSVTALIRSLRNPAPENAIQFGLLLLIATPVARVMLSLIAFALERDWTYVAITSVVLAILVYSLALTAGGS